MIINYQNSYLKVEHSLINALILITSFYVIGITIAPWDIFTHGFMMIAIYYLFLYLKVKQKLETHSLASLGIAASLLSKGPVSTLLLPFIIAFSFFNYKNLKAKIIPYNHINSCCYFRWLVVSLCKIRRSSYF